MKKVKVKFKKLYDNAKLPERAHPTDAGMDLYAYNFSKFCDGKLINGYELPINLQPASRVLIKCGFAMSIPVGWEAQVRPRSGLALKEGISIVNSPGTIDCSWRGEVAAILINHSKEMVVIRKGDRIAQMVISEVPHLEVEEVEELDDTERGEDGFGSTGK